MNIFVPERFCCLFPMNKSNNARTSIVRRYQLTDGTKYWADNQSTGKRVVSSFFGAYEEDDFLKAILSLLFSFFKLESTPLQTSSTRKSTYTSVFGPNTPLCSILQLNDPSSNLVSLTVIVCVVLLSMNLPCGTTHMPLLHVLQWRAMYHQQWATPRIFSSSWWV